MDRPRPEQLTIRVDPAQDNIRGDESAEFTLVEFADFECRHCAAAARAVDELRERMGSRLRFVFRHFPIPEIHPHAELAAEAAQAAAAQGRFWEMHHLLFTHHDALGRDSLIAYAAQLELDVARFTDELDRHTHARAIQLQAQGGELIGVAGTPAFFIEGYQYTGSYEPEALQAALEGRWRPRGAGGG